MEERFKQETEKLKRMWMQHDQRVLRDYLVKEVEDPRINVQSILTRHFLIEKLFPGEFVTLIEQELRFGVVMNWLARLVKQVAGIDQLHAVLDALLDKQTEAEGIAIPPFVTETFNGLIESDNTLEIPNYIIDLLNWTPVESLEGPIAEYIMSTFEILWRAALTGREKQPLTVLEPACGSANDYRCLAAFGIAPLLDYHGFDLCDKNISNARAMFPETNFQVGNALEIEAADQSFDICFVHDLFEHLSIAAVEQAVAEMCRVTRHAICAGFFNLHPIENHLVQPVEEYHWNCLSRDKMIALFQRHGFKVQDIHINTFLAGRFPGCQYHNQEAWTFIASLCSTN